MSNQQHQRHHQNTSPIVSPSKIIRDASPSSSRGNYRDNYGDSTSASSKSGLVNFGTDPDVEAEKKREMKAAYGRQLQDQQSRAYDSRSYSSETDRSDARTDGYRPSPQQASYDSREEDRNAAVSAAELKRFQQRQYHDEITNAAAAAPINSARTSLRGNSQSRQSPDDGYHPNGPGSDIDLYSAR